MGYISVVQAFLVVAIAAGCDGGAARAPVPRDGGHEVVRDAGHAKVAPPPPREDDAGWQAAYALLPDANRRAFEAAGATRIDTSPVKAPSGAVFRYLFVAQAVGTRNPFAPDWFLVHGGALVWGGGPAKAQEILAAVGVPGADVDPGFVAEVLSRTGVTRGFSGGAQNVWNANPPLSSPEVSVGPDEFAIELPGVVVGPSAGGGGSGGGAMPMWQVCLLVRVARGGAISTTLFVRSGDAESDELAEPIEIVADPERLRAKVLRAVGWEPPRPAPRIDLGPAERVEGGGLEAAARVLVGLGAPARPIEGTLVHEVLRRAGVLEGFELAANEPWSVARRGPYPGARILRERSRLVFRVVREPSPGAFERLDVVIERGASRLRRFRAERPAVWREISG